MGKSARGREAERQAGGVCGGGGGRGVVIGGKGSSSIGGLGGKGGGGRLGREGGGGGTGRIGDPDADGRVGWEAAPAGRCLSECEGPSTLPLFPEVLCQE